jgi:hypothetical protein
MNLVDRPGDHSAQRNEEHTRGSDPDEARIHVRFVPCRPLPRPEPHLPLRPFSCLPDGK